MGLSQWFSPLKLRRRFGQGHFLGEYAQKTFKLSAWREEKSSSCVSFMWTSFHTSATLLCLKLYSLWNIFTVHTSVRNVPSTHVVRVGLFYTPKCCQSHCNGHYNRLFSTFCATSSLENSRVLTLSSNHLVWLLISFSCRNVIRI